MFDVTEIYHQPDADHPDGWVETIQPTLPDAQAQVRADLDALNLAKSTTDFPYDFGSTAGVDDAGDVVEACGVQTLQIRGMQDQANWTAAMAFAQLAVGNGQPDAVQPIKCGDNIWVQTTAAQVITVLTALFQRQIALLARYGQLKHAIADATDITTLSEIDITTGWP